MSYYACNFPTILADPIKFLTKTMNVIIIIIIILLLRCYRRIKGKSSTYNGIVLHLEL